MLMVMYRFGTGFGVTVAVVLGATESTTLTFGVQVALLPDGSDAEQLPSDDPTGKNPEAQLAVQLQLSVQVAVGVTDAPPFPEHSIVVFGQVKTGFCLSTTRMYDVQVWVVDRSLAVATTGIV